MKLSALAALILSSCLAIACAAPSGNEASSAAAVTGSAEYDAAKNAPEKIVVTDDMAITPTQSYATHAVAFYPAVDAATLVDRIARMQNWTGVTGATGIKPFVEASVVSDATSGDVRTIKANLLLLSDNPIASNVPLAMT